MKKIILIAVAAILAVSALAQDGKSLYSKYSNEKNVFFCYNYACSTLVWLSQ